MKEYNWAQEKIDALTGTKQDERNYAQIENVRQAYRQMSLGENRAQRRERERQERRALKRKVVKA